MTLHELVTRLEASLGRTGELDAEIAKAVGIRFRSRRDARGRSKGRQWFVDSHGGVEQWSNAPPDYTSSLDAALQLVPEGNEFHFLRGAPIGKLYLFEHREPSEYGWTQGAIVHRGEHNHAAIAVCIAALKARSQP